MTKHTNEDLARQEQALRDGYDGHLYSPGDLVHYDPEHDPSIWDGKREPWWLRVAMFFALAWDAVRGIK